MQEIDVTTLIRPAVSIVVLCVLIAGGFYLMSIFRDYAADNRGTTDDVLANLQEMRRKGDISEEEFRTLESRTHRPPVGPRSIDDSTSSDDSSHGSPA